MATVALRRFSTLPNIPLSYARGGSGHATTHFAPFTTKYAATEVADNEDEEMTSVSEDEDDITESLEQEGQGERSTPNTSLQEPFPESDKKRQLVRDEEQLGSHERFDQEHAATENIEDDALLGKDLSEWETEGGLHAIEAAMEGTYLLELSLDAIAEWCAPIVWKLFLRQSLLCSASATHANTLPQDTPTPQFLPKLLTRAMPRYKGEMTRAIAVTHALLYLYRIRTCFHCTGSSASHQKLGHASANAANIDTSNLSTTESTVSNNGKDQGEQFRTLLLETASQCSLFFAVGMHYASLWLLDCCPSEKAYWKRYVHCVPTARGVAWSRLVLQHWNYRINISVEDWLSFCSQLLVRFPVVDDHAREALHTLQNGF